MKKICYYTLETLGGEVLMATRTLRLAKKYPVGDICYRRIVGKPLRKKFMFMWYN